MEGSHHEGEAASSSGPLWPEEGAHPSRHMSDDTAPNSASSQHHDSSTLRAPNIDVVMAETEKGAELGDMPTGDSNRMSLQNQATPNHDTPLDRNARELSEEIDEIFDSYDNSFGPRQTGEEDEADDVTELSNAQDGEEDGAYSAPLCQGVQALEDASSQDEKSGDAIENSRGMAENVASPIPKPSISRRRHRPSGQMESISEAGNNASERGYNDAHPLHQSGDASDNYVAPTSSPFTTPRRRIRTSGESTGSTGRESTSTGSGGQRTRIRRSRRFLERNGRSSNPNNSLVASLDAGMATLRRWIRARRPSFGSGSDAGGLDSSSGHNSVSSMTTTPLREEDIFALSHTGSEPRRTTRAASSTSSDPRPFDPNSSDGFLYYRPYEVHVRPPDLDAESGIYASDEESGARSILLHPLVPSSVSSSLGEDSSQQSFRQRAQSEPDRVRVRDFLSTVYGTRAIDAQDTDDADNHRGGRALHQSHHGASSLRSAVPTMIIEEEADVVDIELHEQQGLQEVSALEAAEESSPVPPDVEPTAADNGIASIESDQDSSAPDDPNRRARSRWIRINQRFRCMITSVAILFSLLLFCIVISWVLFATTYVLSINKECDVPLRAYFWLATTQLVLDIFRADIMRWLCRYRTDGHRTPPRVILYNVAYLAYAALALRVGVKSVFVTPSTCSDTTPELFYAGLVFVTLSLACWALIILGYLIPFCFVAVLLTRNGYFPNGGITSSRGVMGGRPTRVPMTGGRIEALVAEAFPNNYSNPAPPGCVDRLRVIMLHEFPDSYQRECCICMQEYSEGEVIVATPCEHVFHKRCCQEWLTLSRTCPVCREDLPEALGMSEEASEAQGNINIMRYLGRERRQNEDETSDRRGGTEVAIPGNDEP